MMSQNLAEFSGLNGDSDYLNANEVYKLLINERDNGNPCDIFSHKTLLHLPVSNCNELSLMCGNNVEEAVQVEPEVAIDELNNSAVQVVIPSLNVPSNNDMNVIILNLNLPSASSLDSMTIPQIPPSEAYTLHSDPNGQVFLIPSSGSNVLSEINAVSIQQPSKPKWPPAPGLKRPCYCTPYNIPLKNYPVLTKSRCKKVAIDQYKSISFHEFKSQLQDTSDILRKLQLAPPNKKSLRMKLTGGIEKLFAHPGRPIPNKRIKQLFSRHLIFTEQFHSPTPDMVLESLDKNPVAATNPEIFYEGIISENFTSGVNDSVEKPVMLPSVFSSNLVPNLHVSTDCNSFTIPISYLIPNPTPFSTNPIINMPQSVDVLVTSQENAKSLLLNTQLGYQGNKSDLPVIQVNTGASTETYAPSLADPTPHCNLQTLSPG